MKFVKKAKKNNETKEEEGSKDDMNEDRLSDLPDAIIISILSLLPTILAVRMSIVSKRYRNMWTQIHALDFCDSREVDHFKRPDRKHQERKRFFNFIDRCLSFPYPDTIIKSFKLDLGFYGAAKKIDSWLRFSIAKSVKELDLSVIAKRIAFYSLPDDVLRLRSLTVLKLQGIVLKTLVSTTLPCLKSLYLTKVSLQDEILACLVTGSPLETLHLMCCYGLLAPRIDSLTLKFLEIQNSPPILNQRCLGFRIKAKNLVSLDYEGESAGYKCIVLLHPCPTLKSLWLTGVHLMEKWTNDLIPHLPSLEYLNFTNCTGLDELKIQNDHVKTIVIRRDSEKLESWDFKATINAPSLVSFGYAGFCILELTLCSPNLFHANVEICRLPNKMHYYVQWYMDLINFLSQLNSCLSVRILCEDEKALIIPRELREIYPSPMPGLKHLKLEALKPLYRKAMIRKTLHWLSPSLESLEVLH